ncbi:sugar ABC transporter permease [Eubacteriales bacterium OttesenSCG-928-N13]|nr:sugar ABC transporter permease [Eubacteriales bacterium OttesenSCG-928-N13]
MMRQQKKPNLGRSPGVWLDDHLAQIFLIPALILIAGLIAYPAALTIYNSFTNLSMLTMKATKFVGFQNYATVLGGSEFWVSLRNSLVFTVGSISGQLILGMIGALALQRIPFGRTAFRVGLLVPWTFPSVAMTFVWDWMLDSGFGIINFALMGLGIIGEPIAWFGSRTWAMFSVIIMNIWFGAPFMMLALNAGLQTIPSDYYEVGKIEGANFFQRLRYIILPSLKKIVGVLLILRTIWVFNNYDFIFLTTGGGPAKATQTVSIMAYFTAWKRSAMGRGSAITILLLVFVAVMIALYFKFFKIDSEEA